MKTKIFGTLILLCTLCSCSKENIDETNEISLHTPTVITDNGASLNFKLDKSNSETTVESSFCTTYSNYYFITPEVPCIEEEGRSFSIRTSGDEQYAIYLIKENGDFNLVTSFLLTHDPESPHISSRGDNLNRHECITNKPEVKIHEETEAYIVGTLKAEFFKTISDENIEDPFSFCMRTESIGLVNIEFVALKVESDCE